MINPLAGSFDEKLIKDLKLWLHVLGLLSALQFSPPLPNWLRLGLKLPWQGKGRIVRLFPGWPEFYYATEICECIRLPVCIKNKICNSSTTKKHLFIRWIVSLCVCVCSSTFLLILKSWSTIPVVPKFRPWASQRPSKTHTKNWRTYWRDK